MVFELFVGPYIFRLANSICQDENTSGAPALVKDHSIPRGDDSLKHGPHDLSTHESLVGKNGLKRKRSVRFAVDESEDEIKTEEVNGVCRFALSDDSYYDIDEEIWRSSLWWTGEEYAEIRSSTRRIGKELHNRGYSSFLGDALPDSLTPGMNGSVDHFEFKDEVKTALLQWCTFGHSRRGLEKRSNVKHYAKRDLSRSNALRAVLDAQNENEATTESLAEAYRSSTRSSKNFALMMGYADAQAAGNSFVATQSRCKLLLRNLSKEFHQSQ
eukprot:CAMPEP_0194411008 /NCGR_PEP_ID=MMETSP0176-20130528/9131_1 /TAXON_ID=216777 /ORGANISM="Proboscia alata, Strain PI-D3" /LENGTH=270 /DNA_ID=CAMNT_0039212697 /DNA_START=13 /DNA_END=825 /DNA_ORIENTATION=-